VWAKSSLSEGFIGLGPLSTEPSDQVWILQAAKVPFILRPMDKHGTFNLVGETYVHGFMNGEFAVAGLPHGWMEIDLVRLLYGPRLIYVL
jgi:hypothetical protein